MTMNRTCPATAPTPCGKGYENYCQNGGLCCLESPEKPVCACLEGWTGTYCHSKDRRIQQSTEQLKNTGMISAFSAFLGVLVIALFIVVIVLQVKYYRNRKKRPLREEHEMDIVVKRGDSDKDNGYTKFLRTLPGYSWRESVRHNSVKPKGPMWRSVPDLLGIAMTLTSFGTTNKRQNPCDPDQSGQGVTQASNADSTDSTTTAAANARVLSDGENAEKTVHVEIEEDTVD